MNFLRAVSEQLHIFSSPDRSRANVKSPAPPFSSIVEPELPHHSLLPIETEIPHCCFYCSWCASPILLPHENLGMPFGGPLVRKIEARSIGTVCISCGHTGTYSLFRGSQGYDTRYKFVPARHTGMTMLLDWLPCLESTCVFPLPFFVTFDESFYEANVKELAARWSWENLTCSVGHEIQAPRWLFEPGPHRGALDITHMTIKPPR
ncbi:MAG: hypothetical protein ACLPH3_22750 [Terracidiphilus sp.]